MSVFTSKREKRLWVSVLLILTAIYSTLGLAGELAAFLRSRAQLDKVYIACFSIVVIVLIGLAIINKTRALLIFTGLGLLAVYTMVIVRMGLSPEERTHLFEYALVGILIYLALKERKKTKSLNKSPFWMAIVITLLLGWLDEGIQAMIPNRVYDIRDVGFNAIAGISGIFSMAVLNGLKRKLKSSKV
ncbi:MAG: VanZ family protein [Bacteroidia bacterium]|nr:VanZ family protein [Bacteroidia bacterium]MBT8288365.1 VanZ family protein [Bacteroidia bacterium]NNK72105.1 VanZ family protein [Flavobacteriaceae bacterium]